MKLKSVLGSVDWTDNSSPSSAKQKEQSKGMKVVGSLLELIQLHTLYIKIELLVY